MDEIPGWPVNRNMAIDVNLKVATLLRADGQWNVEVLHDLFPVNEVNRIVKLPIGKTSDRDIWAFTSWFIYS